MLFDLLFPRISVVISLRVFANVFRRVCRVASRACCYAIFLQNIKSEERILPEETDGVTASDDILRHIKTKKPLSEQGSYGVGALISLAGHGIAQPEEHNIGCVFNSRLRCTNCSPHPWDSPLRGPTMFHPLL